MIICYTCLIPLSISPYFRRRLTYYRCQKSVPQKESSFCCDNANLMINGNTKKCVGKLFKGDRYLESENRKRRRERDKKSDRKKERTNERQSKRQTDRQPERVERQVGITSNHELQKYKSHASENIPLQPLS